jgi:hypothetical protein
MTTHTPEVITGGHYSEGREITVEEARELEKELGKVEDYL